MIKKSTVGIIGTDSANPTTIYTVPNGKKTEIVMVWITNPESASKGFHLEFYNASEDASVVLLDGYSVSQKDFAQLGGTANTFVMMQEGDKLEAYGETGSNFKVIVSFIEYPDLIKGG